MTQLYISTYLFFLKVYSHLGYYRMLSRAPCALHWSLFSISYIVVCILGFPVAQLVKNPPAMQGTWVRSHFLLQEDLPDPEIKFVFPALQEDSSALSHLGSHRFFFFFFLQKGKEKKAIKKKSDSHTTSN